MSPRSWRRPTRWSTTAGSTSGAFRDFVFTNPARFYTGTNPAFFEGTVVEDAVAGLLEGG